MLSTDEAVLEMLSLDEGGIEDLGRGKSSSVINSLFYRTASSNSLDSIYIYSFANGWIATWTDFKPMGEFHDSGWLGTWEKGLSEFAMTKCPESGSPDTITIVREMLSDGSHVGLAAFNIKLDAFASLVDQSFNISPEDICIMSVKVTSSTPLSIPFSTLRSKAIPPSAPPTQPP
jgi:hypothetical protein